MAKLDALHDTHVTPHEGMIRMNRPGQKVLEYALRRWARGEEEAAQRGAIDPTFHGIRLTCWLRVLAAAMAGAHGSTHDHKAASRATRTKKRGAR